MEEMGKMDGEETKTAEKKRKKGIPFLLQLLLLAIMVLILRSFIIGTIYVKGSSMEPNFHHGDLLFINKLSTSIGTPEKGDIVICNVSMEGFHENIIKRVIALPGDEIDLVWNEDSENVEYYLYINGEEIDEPYLAEPMMNKGDMDFPYVVPEDSYFVMGDNRNASSDSRRKAIGAIEKKDLVGKVVFQLYPFDSFGIIS